MSVLSQFFSFGRARRVYLDYAAATPVREEVFDAMRPYWAKRFANPSAIHTEGQRAAKVIADARATCARVLKTPADTITFTSGGTEANNLALMGVVRHALRNGRDPSSIEIIAPAIEHPSILEALKEVAIAGVVVRTVPVAADGKIVLSELERMINEKTLLITCSYVNSEVGTIEDVKRITHAVRTYKKNNEAQPLYVHLDAAQAPLWLSCAVDGLGVDLMSLDGGKMYGPKGVGVLVHARKVTFLPILHGGAQEDGARPGTENVPLIVGFTKALSIAQENWEERSAAVALIRDRGIEKLEREIEGVRLNGSRADRVANNINVSIEGVDGEYAVVALDVGGIAASTKSACGGKKSGGSTVVRTLTDDDARALETLRFTLGEETTMRDIDTMIGVLKSHVALVRRND